MWQPPSQPPSHVAVAITLNAKASSLKTENWPPVKSKPLNRLTHNLSGLIMSTRWTFVPNLVKIRSQGTSGQRVKYNFYPTFNENTEFRKFYMADGHHFQNSFIAIYQPEIIRFQQNLVCRCRLWFQGRLLNKIPKIFKFKMADGRHIENRLLAISRRMIIRLTQNFVGWSRITF